MLPTGLTLEAQHNSYCLKQQWCRYVHGGVQSLSSNTHSRLIANCHVDHSFRCDTNLDATTFSNTLERKGKFDTGLLFLNTSLSSVGFFNNGLTTAVLNDGTTIDSLNDVLMMFVIVGIRLFKHVLEHVSVLDRVHTISMEMPKQSCWLLRGLPVRLASMRHHLILYRLWAHLHQHYTG
jgi:hypothetical protein